MDRNEAASVIRRYLTCTDITHSCNGKCEKCRYHTSDEEKELALKLAINALERPEIIHCYECKHNPKKEWFGCPMAHLNSIQRPEDAWCWRGEREE